MPAAQQIDQCLADIQACLTADFARWLIVDIAAQQLYLLEQRQVLKHYIISTSKYGAGCEQDSYKTPLGVHTIAEKIGAEQPLNMIFKGRQATGELASINTASSQQEDLITSRILWLQGEQQGVNCGATVDSYQRFIYIHGTADEQALGKPASIGCIRLSNADMVALFDLVSVHTPVIIIDRQGK